MEASIAAIQSDSQSEVAVGPIARGRRLIESGVLVDPVDCSRLRATDGRLNSAGGRSYPLVGGTVPVLARDVEGQEAYAQSNPGMTAEYATSAQIAREPWRRRVLRRFDGWLDRALERTTLRSQPAIEALSQLLEGIGGDDVCISIGGGPCRIDQRVLNLNVGPFPNVDIVADAHDLPFAEGSVDRVHLDAVIEHLADPSQAVAELSRVMKPGALVFAATPFLQPYHGYPDHYQNLTLTGHARLFERHGFEIVSSGACVGPAAMFSDLVANLAATLLPRRLNVIVHRFLMLTGLLVRPLDKWLLKMPSAHVLASTTFVFARRRSDFKSDSAEMTPRGGSARLL